MCCGTKLCCLCLCIILVVIAIGMLFGFGIFKHGFHKLKDTVHDYDPTAVSGGAAYGRRPFLGFTAPPPY
ncbi:uncharacterized protein LOC111396488 [Olea europaea var. sylvestris]|uniref:uncharacterized protein LOC111396488 n=1 Tax=Olea europaea var. sylvestris TaxID=158386 RepID=UPI000C1D7794|nr:uncharacterized protein LOC111396488 [Olea europaea var. sylvestris]